MPVTEVWTIPQPVYSSEKLDKLRARLDKRLAELSAFSGRMVQHVRMSVEDVVIADGLMRQNLTVELAMIDTGVLNLETLAFLKTVQEHFRRYLRIYHPNFHDQDAFIAENGRFAMYESVDLRQSCCDLRLKEPLARMLKGAQAWLSSARSELQEKDLPLNFKESYGEAVRFNPLYDFSEADVWALAHADELPINPLYKKGYRYIGCAPCTRAVGKQDGVHLAQWWWENKSK